MARDRPPSFQFYPRDLLTSRAVVLMTPEERGGYLFLLCHAWDSDEPGVLPNDDVALASLSGLGERWMACRERIIAAFTIEQRRNVLMQVRMMQERQAQIERFRQAQKGASLTNAARWSKVAQRPDSESLSGRYGVTPASASASAVEASTVIANAITPSTPVEAAIPSPATNGRVRGTPRAPCKDWIESFDAHFWPAYPRHVGKGAALRAWNKLGLSPEATPDPAKFFNRVMDGLDAWKARHSGTEPEFTPHPSTWLNQRRWEDTDR